LAQGNRQWWNGRCRCPFVEGGVVECTWRQILLKPWRSTQHSAFATTAHKYIVAKHCHAVPSSWHHTCAIICGSNLLNLVLAKCTQGTL
jgi:hypothetical protein